jgi:hypothetical protein
MNDRRQFLAQLAILGAGPALGVRGTDTGSVPGSVPITADDRSYWLNVVDRLSRPVLTSLAAGRLRERMPVEVSAAARSDRRDVSHLEAVGRLLCGIAPWLELGGGEDAERRLRGELADLARRGLAVGTDATSADHLNFTRGGQPLVDAAFLAHAFLRAPRALWAPLDAAVKRRLIDAFRSTRSIRPGFSNWLLFSAMIEAALAKFGEDWDRMRVDYAIRQHEQWYKGDGIYGDGPAFHWDYYNSYVIQPMLLDILDTVGSDWTSFKAPMVARARRYAAIQERLISPEGTFPPIGRSIAYRFGAFQLLAQMALRRELPDGVSPAQVRSAMTAVIRRSLDAPGTFDANGWLTIGLAGHQPDLGEGYISTGSLYLCAAALLPLGLPMSDEFWSAPAADWTAKAIWSGRNAKADRAGG